MSHRHLFNVDLEYGKKLNVMIELVTLASQGKVEYL